MEHCRIAKGQEECRERKWKLKIQKGHWSLVLRLMKDWRCYWLTWESWEKATCLLGRRRVEIKYTWLKKAVLIGPCLKYIMITFNTGAGLHMYITHHNSFHPCPALPSLPSLHFFVLSLWKNISYHVCYYLLFCYFLFWVSHRKEINWFDWNLTKKYSVEVSF